MEEEGRCQPKSNRKRATRKKARKTAQTCSGATVHLGFLFGSGIVGSLGGRFGLCWLCDGHVGLRCSHEVLSMVVRVGG